MMKRTGKPAIASEIAPVSGSTRDGQPISYNRAPAPDLKPWIARLYATIVDVPPGYQLHCGLLNDTANVRIQLRGSWWAETSDGPLTHNRAALFFGPQSRRMPVSVSGSFISVGMSLRPGACHALNWPKLEDYLDRIAGSEIFGEPEEEMLALFSLGDSLEDWLQAMEGMLRKHVALCGGVEPDPVTARFEAIGFTDPSMGIADFARECGIGQRRLERIIRRDFGLAPKQVLRRARALDMASHLRGVADQEEAAELVLRYYDQSHLIREFIELFGMPPGQFVATPQPLLTSALESRQARRLEFIERLAPGDVRPWQ